MAKVLGIDLGAHTVKVAVFEGRAGNLALTEVHLRAVPPLPPVALPEPPEGEDEDAEPPPPAPRVIPLGARLAVLAELLQDIPRDEATVYAAALPTDQVSIRTVKLPFSDRDRIQKTLPFELESYVPFDLDEFLLASRVRTADEGAVVLCALAPNELIRELLGGLQSLGIDPKHLVLDADVLGGYANGNGVQAVIDLGHTRTLISVVKDGEVIGVRAFSRAGRALTEALAERSGMDEVSAEGAKHVTRLPVDPGVAGPASEVEAEWDSDEATDPQVAPSVSTPNLAQKHSVDHLLLRATEPLLAELRTSLISLEDELGVGIDELLVTGGTSGLEGLTELLGQDLGVPVRHIQLGQVAEGAGDPGRFGMAHILGQKGAGTTGGQELSFRQGEFAYAGELALLRNLVGLGLVALLMFAVVGAGVFGVRSVQYNNEIKATKAEVAAVVGETFPDIPESKLESMKTALSIMNERVTEVTTQAEALGAVVGSEPPVLTNWLELANAMPAHKDAQVDVTDLTISTTGISGKVETTSYEAAGEIERSLQANERFSAARKSNESKRGEIVRFDLSISFEDEGDEGEEG